MENKKGTKALGQEGTKYCILENDGVALCVCKHKPCEQLQLARAEIEQLKSDIKRYSKINEQETKDYAELKAENEKLKEENITLKGGFDFQNKMNEKINKKYSKTLKYRQCLKEIKEILKNEHPFKDCSCGQDILDKISECEYFQEDGGENTCRAEEDYTGTVVCCSACDNCYYKQLQRARAEIEELKADIRCCNSCERVGKVYGNELAKLKAENEKLKESLKMYQYSDEQHLLKVIQLEQCLQEIRDFLDVPEFYIYGKEVIHDRIQDKINEVIGVE